MQVNTPPSVNVGVLIRGPPHAVLEALAEPGASGMYTKSSGRMSQGTTLSWEWEMYVRRLHGGVR